MKKPRRLQSSPSPRKKSRARILTVLGAIGLAAVSYECGQSSRDDKISQLKASSLAKGAGLIKSKKNMRQCRQVVNRLAKSKKFTPRQLREVQSELAQPDEAQCVDIMNKTAFNKAIELAHQLCISNPDDIDKLTTAMRRNYTELLSVSIRGDGLNLVDPDSDMTHWVYLSEPMECIPSEYVEIDPDDDDTIIALREQLVEGEHEEIINNFDLESICPSDEERNPAEELSCKFFSDLQRGFSETSDLDERRNMLCESVVEGLTSALDSPSDLHSWVYERTVEQRRRDAMENIYSDALFRSAGFKDDDEGFLHCLVSSYNKTPEPVFEEDASEEGKSDELDYEDGEDVPEDEN